MFGIIDAIENWIRDLLISLITSNLTTLFDDVNSKVGTISTEVGQTPQGWNTNIFQMIRTLSDNVILPIAGLIITFVLCYELITAITEKNNMHDVDTFIFFKYVFKAAIAVYLLSHTFDITMAVFDVAQTVVTQAGGIITNETSIDIATTIAAMETEMEAMSIGGLVQLALENINHQLISQNHVHPDHGHPLWQNDRNLLNRLNLSDPVCHHDKQGMGEHRNQLFQNTFLPRIPGILYDRMRCDLCGPGQ